jgi:ketosteroid isomerase-like protein
MDAFNRRDAEAAMALMAPDVVFHPVSTRAMGREEPFVGLEGMREYLDLTEREWEELHVEVVQIEQAGDAVTVIGRAHGRGPGGELNATAIWTWKLRDGLVVEGRVHADTARARAALGLEPD